MPSSLVRKTPNVLVPMTRRQSSAVKAALSEFLSTEDAFGRFGGKDAELVREVLQEVEFQRKMARWEKPY